MSTKWLYLPALLLLLVGCRPAETPTEGLALQAKDTAADTQPKLKDAAAPEPAVLQINDTLARPELSRQLKINRDALLKGSSEQIRLDAASVMLFSEEPLARRILLDALKQSENSAARLAVCKALNQTRTGPESVKQKGDFVQPLFEILKTEADSAQVKLAAEATLIFEYKQIAAQFEELTTAPALPATARVNAAYALKLQPDMKAIVRLIKLLDDSDRKVVDAAEQALHSLGIPVGKDAGTRKQIIKELQRKGRDEFLRDWLVRQEAQLRSLETKLALWQERYVRALARMYDAITEDAARGRFLAEFLVDAEPTVRLWALEKVYQGRVGTTSKLPVELGPILIGLISDPDRDVRLQTARLLSLMGQLNSSRRLLQQLDVEPDHQVRMEFFVALGGACHYAFSPNSEFRIPEHIREKTLAWAEKYLSQQDAKSAQKGAEVIKKLLEQDGLAAGEVERYLGLLAQRYAQQKDQAGGGALAAEFLNAMAGLCAQSVYKNQAAKRFAPLFAEALNDEADLVRKAAVDGLVYIDKNTALKHCRVVLVNDSSPLIRKKLIDLAGEVGSQEDLLWLAEKIASPPDSEPAWQAMLKIFRRSDWVVLDGWLHKFEQQALETALSDEQRLVFLEIAERKAVAENKPGPLRDIRAGLAQLYVQAGRFEKAAEYLVMLRESAPAKEQKLQILASLLNVFLRWPKPDQAAQLVNNCLLEQDLEPNSVIVRTIDDYLSNPPGAADPNNVLKALSENIPDDRPLWAQQLSTWTERLSRGRASQTPKPD